jgi:hypothetical protein
MSVCLLHQDGEIRLHRNMQASPETFLKAIAPSRDAMVVAVACLCTWYGLADLCAPAGSPFVLGPARALPAIHGGKATHDPLDAQKMAVVLRGGRREPAAVAPAARRATRDLLRRRLSLTRKRAELLAHRQKTPRQSPLPELGQKLPYTAHRTGVAERCPAPAVPTSRAVARALRGDSEPRRRARAWPRGHAATPPDAHTRHLRQPVPGLGPSLRRVLLSESPESPRGPRVPAGLSACRLGTGAPASAGTR